MSTPKKATYQELNPRNKFIVDGFAMHYTPTQVHRMLKQSEEFSSEVPAVSTLAGYKVRFGEVIRQRRYEIGDNELPVIDPTWRYMRLQEIIEESIEGVEKETRIGTVIVKDYRAAISALSEVNKMTGFTGKRDTDEKEEAQKLMKSILEELRSDLLKTGANPEDVDAIIEQKQAEFASELVQ